jgi:AsmA protein
LSSKRARLAILVLVLAAGALAFQPWRIAEQTVERYLVAQLSNQLGVRVEAVREGAVALLPTPRLTANGVVAQVNDVRVNAPRITATLKLTSLLTGTVAFDEITLLTPVIDVRAASSLDLIGVLRSRQFADLPETPALNIRDGTVMIRSGESIITTARNVTLSSQEREKGEAFEVSGAFVWRSEPVSFAWATDSARRATAPALTVRSEPLNIDFTARRALAADAPLAGAVAISSRQADRAAGWIGAQPMRWVPPVGIQLSGALTVEERAIQLRSASLAIAGETLDGAIDWRRQDDQWLLSGTLAGRSLDLSGLLSAIDQRQRALGDVAAASPDLIELFQRHVDLRLSIGRVRAPGLTLGEVATQLILSPARFDLSVTSATLHRGSLRGRVAGVRTETGADIRGSIAAERVDLATLSAEFFDVRRMTGSGALQAQFEGHGRTLSDLVDQAQGRLVFTARQGDFMGTNLNDAMRRIERQPLAVARDWRGGRTAFDHLTVNGLIHSGMIELADSTISGQAYRVALNGRLSLRDRFMGVAGAVQSVSGQTAVPFDIIGPLADPQVIVNTRAMLERSGAAAPLLGGGRAN